MFCSIFFPPEAREARHTRATRRCTNEAPRGARTRSRQHQTRSRTSGARDRGKVPVGEQTHLFSKAHGWRTNLFVLQFTVRCSRARAACRVGTPGRPPRTRHPNVGRSLRPYSSYVRPVICLVRFWLLTIISETVGEVRETRMLKNIEPEMREQIISCNSSGRYSNRLSPR